MPFGAKAPGRLHRGQQQVAVAGCAAPIADDDAIDERRDQVVQPLGLRPFLKGDMHTTAHATDERNERQLLRRQDAPRDHPAARFPHRGDRGCLVDVQRDILRGPFHESRSLLW